MTQIVVRPLTEEELTALGASMASVEDGALKPRLADNLGHLADPGQNAAWAARPSSSCWQGTSSRAARRRSPTATGRA